MTQVANGCVCSVGCAEVTRAFMSERFLRCVKVPNNKKFCFKIWKTATETYQLQQAYGADAIGRTQVFGSVNVKRVEPQLKAIPARDDRFVDSEGIVHHEYPPDGQTINKEFKLRSLATFA